MSASPELVERWEECLNYGKVDSRLLEVASALCRYAVFRDDLKYGLDMCVQTREWIRQFIIEKGNNFDALEDYQQKKKQPHPILEMYYGILLLEAPHILESFMLYIEKDRPKAERFYEPRVNPLRKVVEKLQALEDDELDELFIHMPARVGKTQLTTMFMTWHCARGYEKSNLYVTYKEGLGAVSVRGNGPFRHIGPAGRDPPYRWRGGRR